MLYTLPGPKSFRQISSGNTGVQPIHHDLEHLTIALCRVASLGFSLRWKQIFDLIPLCFAQLMSFHTLSLPDWHFPHKFRSKTGSRTLAFIARNKNVIFLGPPGVGKTHLSVGLALRALDAGMVVYYTTLSRLIADLKKAEIRGHLKRRWRIHLRPALLIIE